MEVRPCDTSKLTVPFSYLRAFICVSVVSRPEAIKYAEKACKVKDFFGVWDAYFKYVPDFSRRRHGSLPRRSESRIPKSVKIACIKQGF
jgi:hypothetical protein